MNLSARVRVFSSAPKINFTRLLWSSGGVTSTDRKGGKCTARFMACHESLGPTRSYSSDLKQRGLRSLIRRVDTRMGEGIKAELFTANRRTKSKPVSLSTEECDELPEETQLQSRNRNPRNMELLGYNKPRGYGKLYRRRDFWNRLNLVITNSHTTAYIDHHTGEILVSASTQEFGIGRHLRSNTDVCAAMNIGRVIAQRCKESGIDRVFWRMKLERGKEKVQSFMNAAKEEGLRLTEPKRIVLPQSFISNPADFKAKKKKIKFFTAQAKRKHT